MLQRKMHFLSMHFLSLSSFHLWSSMLFQSKYSKKNEMWSGFPYRTPLFLTFVLSLFLPLLLFLALSLFTFDFFCLFDPNSNHPNNVFISSEIRFLSFLPCTVYLFVQVANSNCWKYDTFFKWKKKPSHNKL